MTQDYSTNKNPELIARVVCVKDGKILLCRGRGGPHYFLPGGHVEYGEPALVALKREIKEELNAGLRNPVFIGAVENIFSSERRGDTHEISLLFTGEVIGDGEGELTSAEPGLEFFWETMEDFPCVHFLPRAMQSALLLWLKDGKIFWINQPV